MELAEPLLRVAQGKCQTPRAAAANQSRAVADRRSTRGSLAGLGHRRRLGDSHFYSWPSPRQEWDMGLSWRLDRRVLVKNAFRLPSLPLFCGSAANWRAGTVALHPTAQLRNLKGSMAGFASNFPMAVHCVSPAGLRARRFRRVSCPVGPWPGTNLDGLRGNNAGPDDDRLARNWSAGRHFCGRL